MWLGYAPAGIKSFEVSCIFSPGIVLSPKELTAKERLYGGDGWTTNEYRRFVLATPRSEVLTPAEARAIANAMAL
jgi:hypothetical protein